MRVIGGKLRGKKILNTLDKLTRPPKDIVRESVFNIIEHSYNDKICLDNSIILDIFSGTGSFGIESLSRGASKVTFIENYKNSILILKKNLINLNLSNRCQIIDLNILNINNFNFEKKIFDLVFLDPPFKFKDISSLLDNLSKLKNFSSKTLFVIHRHKKAIDIFPQKFEILKEKIYGISKVIFFKLDL